MSIQAIFYLIFMGSSVQPYVVAEFGSKKTCIEAKVTMQHMYPKDKLKCLRY